MTSLSRSRSPPPKRVKLSPKSPQANLAPSVPDEDQDKAISLANDDDEDAEGDRCSICLQALVDRAVLPLCSHEFCFECIVVWSEQSRRCPLCSGSIGDYLIHRIRGRYDYQKHYLPPLRVSPGPQSLAPLQSQVSNNNARRQARERAWGRRRRDEDREREEEEDRLESAVRKRKWVYEKGLFAKHVASNSYTRYKPCPSPAQFAASSDLIARTTAFLRRELRVWMHMGADVEFLTTLTISLLKSLDIRSQAAVRLLGEFLDFDTAPSSSPSENEHRSSYAEHFAHEVYSYLRSPYRDLFVYDSVVQYDEPYAPPEGEQGRDRDRWRQPNRGVERGREDEREIDAERDRDINRERPANVSPRARSHSRPPRRRPRSRSPAHPRSPSRRTRDRSPSWSPSGRQYSPPTSLLPDRQRLWERNSRPEGARIMKGKGKEVGYGDVREEVGDGRGCDDSDLGRKQGGRGRHGHPKEEDGIRSREDAWDSSHDEAVRNDDDDDEDDDRGQLRDRKGKGKAAEVAVHNSSRSRSLASPTPPFRPPAAPPESRPRANPRSRNMLDLALASAKRGGEGRGPKPAEERGTLQNATQVAQTPIKAEEKMRRPSLLERLGNAYSDGGERGATVQQGKKHTRTVDVAGEVDIDLDVLVSESRAPSNGAEGAAPSVNTRGRLLLLRRLEEERRVAGASDSSSAAMEGDTALSSAQSDAASRIITPLIQVEANGIALSRMEAALKTRSEAESMAMEARLRTRAQVRLRLAAEKRRGAA